MPSSPSSDQKIMPGKETPPFPKSDQMMSKGKFDAERLAVEESTPIESELEQEKNIKFGEAIETEKSNIFERITLVDDNMTLDGRKDLMAGSEKDHYLQIKTSGGLRMENLQSNNQERDLASSETACDEQVSFYSSF